MRVFRHGMCGTLMVGLSLQITACGGDAVPPAAPDVEVSSSLLSTRGDEPVSVAVRAPLFGLDAPHHGGLLAAVASVGVLRVEDGEVQTIAELPGVNDVVAIGKGAAYAVTGGSDNPDLILPTSRKLYRVSRGEARLVADLYAFETRENPDKIWHAEGPTFIESNPFDVALLSHGRVLVADAAANDILVVKPNGDVDWVAVLTPSFTGGPEPVATSVAVGPRGDYFAGELTGFPGTPGLSRVWRIERGSRHVVCPSRACKVVAAGLTSIMDLAFDDDGNLYVVEFDEAGWLGVEANGFARTPAGGTVNKCNVRSGTCRVVASGLSLPTAVAIDHHGTLWVAQHAPMLFAGATVTPVCSTSRRGAHGLPRC